MGDLWEEGLSSLEIMIRDYENTKGLTSWICPDCKIDFKEPTWYRKHRGPSYVDRCGWDKEYNGSSIYQQK